MQKWKIIGVLALYLIGALGVHVQIHFCCGQLSALEWNPDRAAECEKGNKCCKKADCCSSIVIQADIDDDHVASNKLDCGSSAWTAHVISHVSETRPCSDADRVVAPEVYRGPPPIAGKSRCCLFQNWKIDSPTV